MPLALILLLSLAFTSCGKSSSQPAQTQGSPNQTSVAQPNANPAAPDNSAAEAAPATNGAAPVAPAPANQAPPLSIVPARTSVTVRLQQSLSSASAVPGQQFEAVLEEPIVVDNQVVVPAGALVSGHIVSAHRSGRLHHPGELALTLDSVTVGDQQVRLLTSSVVARGGSHKKRNLGWIGGGTGGGALVGALAAGGKGALIGGGVGAAAGTTTALLTGKKDVAFGAERRLTFRLTQDITLPS
ncbi:MAG: hypothetical protein ACLPND_23505 [Candidatus Korobacteraceae bacterium]